MRRRHVQTVREEERPTLLLMAAGAVAGAAAGLYLGRRYRSMDAFIADVKDRFDALRDVWYEDDLARKGRSRLNVELDEIEDEPEELDEELDDFEEDEFDDDSPVVTSETLEDEDDDLYEDDDEFEDELAAVSRENGASEASIRARDIARQLEERVLEELRDEPVLSKRAIEIAVVGDGVVELTGIVHTIEEVSRAAALVRGVPGVNMVLNRVEVRTGGTMDTASVARDPLESPASEDRL